MRAMQMLSLCRVDVVLLSSVGRVISVSRTGTPKVKPFRPPRHPHEGDIHPPSPRLGPVVWHGLVSPRFSLPLAWSPSEFDAPVHQPNS